MFPPFKIKSPTSINLIHYQAFHLGLFADITNFWSENGNAYDNYNKAPKDGINDSISHDLQCFFLSLILICNITNWVIEKKMIARNEGDMSSFNGEVVAWLGCYRGWSG